MWPLRQHRKREIESTLKIYSDEVRNLPGIDNALAAHTLAMQFIASIRREEYYHLLQRRSISAVRADPSHAGFDAERAVVYQIQRRNLDEASWLVFLMIHFGKPASTGWLRVRDIYGMLGEGVWTWDSVVRDPGRFATWLAQNWQHVRGGFGNHRKYESLNPTSRRNTGLVVQSYIDWVGPNGHEAFFGDAVRRLGNNPFVIFDRLFHEMSVVSFGRLGKFDYLSMIGRYNVAPVLAGSAYLPGATGPASGARLLFDGARNGQSSIQELQIALSDLDQHLEVGMQVFEDALCNWQKSPQSFVHFRG